LSSAPDVETIRAQIPATGKYVYLNSGWQGPSPVSVIRAVQDAFQDEAEGPTAPPTHERRLAAFRRSRSALAALIGARTDEISIQQNTTEGVNIVLSGISLRPGTRSSPKAVNTHRLSFRHIRPAIGMGPLSR
jgi:L-cysteine/cystine lyase